MTENTNKTDAVPTAATHATMKAGAYVDAVEFEALEGPPEGHDGIDWAKKVPVEAWQEHEERLRSVIDAQQEAEVLGTDVLIGS